MYFVHLMGISVYFTLIMTPVYTLYILQDILGYVPYSWYKCQSTKTFTKVYVGRYKLAWVYPLFFKEKVLLFYSGIIYTHTQHIYTTDIYLEAIYYWGIKRQYTYYNFGPQRRVLIMRIKYHNKQSSKIV